MDFTKISNVHLITQLLSFLSFYHAQDLTQSKQVTKDNP